MHSNKQCITTGSEVAGDPTGLPVSLPGVPVLIVAIGVPIVMGQGHVLQTVVLGARRGVGRGLAREPVGWGVRG